jgi:hypothetical protein
VIYDTTKLSTLIKFQVSVKIGDAAESAKQDLTAAGATFTGLGHTTADTAVQVFVYAIALSASGNLATFNPVSSPVVPAEYAAYYANIVDSAAFTLTIDAQPTATP